MKMMRNTEPFVFWLIMGLIAFIFIMGLVYGDMEIAKWAGILLLINIGINLIKLFFRN